VQVAVALQRLTSSPHRAATVKSQSLSIPGQRFMDDHVLPSGLQTCSWWGAVVSIGGASATNTDQSGRTHTATGEKSSVCPAPSV
jgi:hypothetical protein